MPPLPYRTRDGMANGVAGFIPIARQGAAAEFVVLQQPLKVVAKGLEDMMLNQSGKIMHKLV